MKSIFKAVPEHEYGEILGTTRTTTEEQNMGYCDNSQIVMAKRALEERRITLSSINRGFGWAGSGIHALGIGFEWLGMIFECEDMDFECEGLRLR